VRARSEVRCASAASPAEDSFILLVGTDPKPVEDSTFAVGQGPVGLVHPCAPHVAEGLQAQRGMQWIMAEEFELFIGLFSNIWWKGVVKIPEFVRSVGKKGHCLRLRALFIHRLEPAGGNIGFDLLDNA